MGMFDKLKFWKKEEETFPEPSFTEPPEKPAEHLEMPRAMEPPSEPPAFSQPQAFSQQASLSGDQQLQLINAKLDTIKAQLETVLQRLEKKDDLSPYQQRWRNV